jgi:hypothetical protein
MIVILCDKNKRKDVKIQNCNMILLIHSRQGTCESEIKLLPSSQKRQNQLNV